jgi:hypothetical protein
MACNTVWLPLPVRSYFVLEVVTTDLVICSDCKYHNFLEEILKYGSEKKEA